MIKVQIKRKWLPGYKTFHVEHYHTEAVLEQVGEGGKPIIVFTHPCLVMTLKNGVKQIICKIDEKDWRVIDGP
jgi:hypothetical protein